MTTPTHHPAGADRTSDEQTRRLEAAVAGLAREVEAIRRRLEALDSLPRRVKTLADWVEQLAQVAAPSKKPAAGTPSWLAQIRDTADAATVLKDLTDWMRAVYLRYSEAADSLPECWLWHPDVVEELLWLRYAWRAAYEDEDASIHLPGDGHDRQLPGVVERIRRTAGTCSLENHLPGGPRHTPPAVPPLTEAVELIADWWGARREDIAPQPTDEHLSAVAGLRNPRRGRR